MCLRFACAVLLVAACSEAPGTGGTGGGEALGGGSGGGGEAGGGEAGGGGELNDAGVACTSSNSQPDVCGYGNFCDDASMTCAAAPVGSCINFTASNPALQWDPTLSTGAVIYSAIDDADIAADCTTGATPFTVTLNAYANAPDTFPAQKSNLPGLFYYTTTGTQVDIPASLLKQSNYVVSADSMNASMTFTLCSTTATTSLVAGFAFTGGNPFCATLTNP